MTIKRTGVALVLTLILQAAMPAALGQNDHQYLKFRIDGATTPDAIPIWVKVEYFLRIYHGGENLLEELNSRDRELLIMALKDSEWMRGATAVLNSIRHRNAVCPILTDESEAAELIATTTELDQAHDEMVQSHYERFLNGLSPGGRAAVLAYIDREITPGVVFEEVDYVAMVNSDPETYLKNTRRMCDSPPLRGELIMTREQRGQATITTRNFR